MISLCALCLAGVASAQVLKSPLSEKTQNLEQQSEVVPFKVDRLGVQTAESSPVRKEGADIDSIFVQAGYEWFESSGPQQFRWMGTANLGKLGYCNEDQIKWVYGTGGFISMAGTGEIGYRFFVGDESFYSINNMYPRYGVPYAAAALIERAPSTSRAHMTEDGEVYYDSMPFYFKLYNSTKVGAQQVIKDLSGDGPTQGVGEVDVVYPTDPEKYTALSDTVMIPAGCIYDEEGKGWADGDVFKAEFQNIDAAQPLGDNFCVSMMFPIDWDAEGDTVIASTWNAFPYMLFMENGTEAVSEETHSVYYVYDFERVSGVLKRPEDHKRPEGLVLEESMQPNMRYAVIPFDSWYWEDVTYGLNTNAEPYLWVYYTDWTSIQSANKADRYVQVSPVPAVDFVNFKSFTAMSRIEIYSLGGQLVKAVNVSGDSYRLDIAGLNSGMYVARIYSEKGISSKKLIVR